MLKNVLLPLVLIALTSWGTIYLWYHDTPLSLFGIIGFFTLGLGSMYISYYIFARLFPSKHNHPMPSLADLPFYMTEKKHAPVYVTTGSVLGGLCAVLLTVGGIFLWITLAGRYEQYHLQKYGEVTYGVVTDMGYKRRIGVYREYQFHDNKGHVHSDRFRNKTLFIGDTIQIKYSTERPIIHKVVTPLEDE